MVEAAACDKIAPNSGITGEKNWSISDKRLIPQQSLEVL
jgi:hypothetical protein